MVGKKTLGLIVKPTHRCNLNCSYCYDTDFRTSDEYKQDMSLDMISRIAKLAKNTSTDIQWIWHGGEALLMGQEWIESAQAIIKSEVESVRFSIQTNGLLLDEDTSQFLVKNKIGVGVSYDWSEQSENRTTEKQACQILTNIKNHHDNAGRIGVISVVDAPFSKRLIDNYLEAKKAGLNDLSFNFIFKKDYLATPEEVYDDFLAYTENWKSFLTYWAKDVINPISERNVFDIFKAVMGNKEGACAHSGCLGKWLGINPLGEIYQCDRFFPRNYSYGRVQDFKYSLNEAFLSEGYLKMAYEYSKSRTKCLSCELYDVCGGGCLGSKINLTGNVKELDENWCFIKKELFWTAFEIIKDLSDEDFKHLNPLLGRYLKENGYRSLSFIKQILEEREISRHV